jgi:hypothetical protein
VSVTTTKAEQAADALCDSLPLLLKRSGAIDNNCILSARLITLACHRVGIKAQPLACGVVALSPDLAAFLDRGGPWGPDAPGWSVAIGQRESVLPMAVPKAAGPTGWNGHLVTLIDGNIFVDTSIGQVCRPKHDLLIKPFHSTIDKPFLSAFLTGESGYRLDAPNGSAVLYQARPDNKSYLTAPDWAETPKRDRALVLDTLNIIKEAL